MKKMSMCGVRAPCLSILFEQVAEGMDFKGKPARNVALVNATIDRIPFLKVVQYYRRYTLHLVRRTLFRFAAHTTRSVKGPSYLPVDACGLGKLLHRTAC